MGFVNMRRGPARLGVLRALGAEPSPYQFRLAGQVFSASGSAVASATVWLFDALTNAQVGLPTTTDSFGAFQFITPTNGPYWCRFYKAGAPNFFGTTDILVPS